MCVFCVQILATHTDRSLFVLAVLMCYVQRKHPQLWGSVFWVREFGFKILGISNRKLKKKSTSPVRVGIQNIKQNHTKSEDLEQQLAWCCIKPQVCVSLIKLLIVLWCLCRPNNPQLYTFLPSWPVIVCFQLSVHSFPATFILTFHTHTHTHFSSSQPVCWNGRIWFPAYESASLCSAADHSQMTKWCLYLK